MSIYLVSEDDLFNWVSKKAGRKLTANELIISPPIVNPDVDHPENSKIRVTVKREVADLTGSEVLWYNRLDLAVLANYPHPDYPPVGALGASVYSLLTLIRNSMGIEFTTRDLEETFVEPNGARGKLLLKAKPTSVGWIGEHYLELAEKPSLATLFTSDKIFWS